VRILKAKAAAKIVVSQLGKEGKMQPNTPFPTRAAAEQWRASQATDVAILAGRQPVPEEAPGLSEGLLLKAAKLLGIVLLLLVLAILFFLFGEDRTREVARPALTPAQRANAFKI
jgi:hypothetical protein